MIQTLRYQQQPLLACGANSLHLHSKFFGMICLLYTSSPSSAARERPSSAQNDVLELIDKDAKRRHFNLSRLTVHLCDYDHHVFDGLAVLVRDITNEYEVSRLKDDVIGLVAHELKMCIRDRA